MHATRILSEEHRVIERVIAAMEAAAGRVASGDALRPGFFLEAVRFIREFADGWHHAKEEGALFTAMAEAGMPMDDGPIGVMLYEHEHARDLTAKLARAAQAWDGGDAGAALDVVDYARAYADLLTGHIYKEDNILFPMAAQAVAPGAQDAILDAFARIEEERAGASPKVELLALAQALSDEAGVDPNALRPREVQLPCHQG